MNSALHMCLPLLGPFTGTQMHDWYSHSYFTNDLPLRRESESTFHTLAELKTSTGNAVQPFLSPVRPRNLPPNLPIPLSALQAASSVTSPVVNDLADSFRRLGVHEQPPSRSRSNTVQQSQQLQQASAQGNAHERNLAMSPNVYGPQIAFNQPFSPPSVPYISSPRQGWGQLPAINTASRMNGAFGSVGMPSPIGSAPFSHRQQQQSLYSPVIGGPVHHESLQNGFFSSTVGVGAAPSSPWGIPQPPQQTLQQSHYIPQQPSPLPAWQPSDLHAGRRAQYEIDTVVQQPPHERLAAGASLQAESVSQVTAADEAEEPIDNGEEELGSSIFHTSMEKPVELTPPTETPEPVLTAKPAVQSVWAQKPVDATTPPAPSRRKSSLTAPASAQLPLAPMPVTTPPADKLPPAPASLPPKPLTTRHGSIADALKLSGPPSTEKSTSTSKPAPWTVAKDDVAVQSPSGPSLRDIQEAEAKKSEARKQANAEARAMTASPAQTPSIDEMPQNMTWGLPSQGRKQSGIVSPAVEATPAAPVWGGGDAGPKKTLKQIQDEEEKRKAKVAAQARAVQAAAGVPAGLKRGYADLASNTTVSRLSDIGGTLLMSYSLLVPAGPQWERAVNPHRRLRQYPLVHPSPPNPPLPSLLNPSPRLLPLLLPHRRSPKRMALTTSPPLLSNSFDGPSRL